LHISKDEAALRRHFAVLEFDILDRAVRLARHDAAGLRRAGKIDEPHLADHGQNLGAHQLRSALHRVEKMNRLECPRGCRPQRNIAAEDKNGNVREN
jgi:hypothetical protein